MAIPWNCVTVTRVSKNVSDGSHSYSCDTYQTVVLVTSDKNNYFSFMQSTGYIRSHGTQSYSRKKISNCDVYDMIYLLTAIG